MSHDRPPVVLIHGIDDTAAKFDLMQAHLQAQGWDTYAPSLTPNNGEAGLDVLAQQVVEFIETQVPAEQPIDLIGFSMGGIISRYYLQRLGGDRRVRRFITIASPHRGTWLAYGRWGAGVVQMRPDSPFLQELNEDDRWFENCEVTVIWTPYDLMIVPADSSTLPRAKNYQIPVAVHAWMVSDRRCLETVTAILQAPSAELAR